MANSGRVVTTDACARWESLSTSPRAAVVPDLDARFAHAAPVGAASVAPPYTLVAISSLERTEETIASACQRVKVDRAIQGQCSEARVVLISGKSGRRRSFTGVQNDKDERCLTLVNLKYGKGLSLAGAAWWSAILASECGLARRANRG